MPAQAGEKERSVAGRAGGGADQGAGTGALGRGMRGALALGLVLISAGLAAAHSWYPLECCSDRDCYPVPAGRVQVVPGGWIVDGFAVRHGEARPSPDGRFHICRRDDGKGDLIRLQGKPACVWAPVEGS